MADDQQHSSDESAHDSGAEVEEAAPAPPEEFEDKDGQILSREQMRDLYPSPLGRPDADRFFNHMGLLANTAENIFYLRLGAEEDSYRFPIKWPNSALDDTDQVATADDENAVIESDATEQSSDDDPTLDKPVNAGAPQPGTEDTAALSVHTADGDHGKLDQAVGGEAFDEQMMQSQRLVEAGVQTDFANNETATSSHEHHLALQDDDRVAQLQQKQVQLEDELRQLKLLLISPNLSELDPPQIETTSTVATPTEAPATLQTPVVPTPNRNCYFAAKKPAMVHGKNTWLPNYSVDGDKLTPYQQMRMWDRREKQAERRRQQEVTLRIPWDKIRATIDTDKQSKSSDKETDTDQAKPTNE